MDSISQRLKLPLRYAITDFQQNTIVDVFQPSEQPIDLSWINLILIEKAGKFRYSWIKDRNRLLYDPFKHRERELFCERCLHGYSGKDPLQSHKPECLGIGQTAVGMDILEQGEPSRSLEYTQTASSLPPDLCRL